MHHLAEPDRMGRQPGANLSPATPCSVVLIDGIWTALSKPWENARINAPRSVALPITGSGHANTQVGSNPLLMLIRRRTSPRPGRLRSARSGSSSRTRRPT
jgi:hypothetical protein